MRSLTIIIVTSIVGLLSACTADTNKPDASGTFEATEILVSAQATGRLERFAVQEGDVLDSGQAVGVIDTTQLWLRIQQVESQMQALLQRRPNTALQLAALQEQLRSAQHEVGRLEQLRSADAATAQQLDQAQSGVATIQHNIDALRSTLDITTRGIESETQPLSIQLKQLQDQLEKCRITSPIHGRVLATYAEQYESTVTGKPLFTIARTTTLTLRAYVTGDQLTAIKIGQPVTVLSDVGKDGRKAHKGTLTWISNKAEFTPKTIQTRDERANLVYAIKITVPNDDELLKIGMYADVRFKQ